MKQIFNVFPNHFRVTIDCTDARCLNKIYPNRTKPTHCNQNGKKQRQLTYRGNSKTKCKKIGKNIRLKTVLYTKLQSK